MILTAIQNSKYNVRIVTDKGTRYTQGILIGYTAQTVTVKTNEKSTTAIIKNENGATIRYIPLR